MHGSLRTMPEASPSGPFDIRPPQKDERELFLHCYLESFGAPPQGRAAAVRNMRHLFEWPDLHFLLAFRESEPVGIAMLLQVDDAALFCAGGVLPQVQNQGCHAALLGARTELARQLGCREVFSWTDAGTKSQNNMMQAGLSVVGVTETWSFHSHP
jgi:GNAT superfamily N-acetyltransferase